jgi:hypothetical protein
MPCGKDDASSTDEIRYEKPVSSNPTEAVVVKGETLAVSYGNEGSRPLLERHGISKCCQVFKTVHGCPCARPSDKETSEAKPLANHFGPTLAFSALDGGAESYKVIS